MIATQQYTHIRLACGIDLAIEHLPQRGTVAGDIKLLTGMVDEPADRLGLANIVDNTITKGTANRTGQQVSDAFDAIGAQHSSYSGRETFGFKFLCLPEFIADVLDLNAEIIRTPSFPQDVCDVAVDLAKQELLTIEDEPDEVARRMIAARAYGPILGRHALGTMETLGHINRDAIVNHWRTHFAATRMLVTLAGAVDADAVADRLESAFSGFGAPPNDGRRPHAIEFSPGRTHQNQELEQEQIYLCWPGAAATSDDYPIERLIIAILSDGMSSRLFTEVREKRGLVYWVGAWHEHPRSGGMNFIGASSTPSRSDETFEVLLREVDRLAEDITDEELRRAKVGIIAKSQTHGDITRARAGRVASDLFYFGRPVPIAEKLAKIEAVTQDDIRGYLARYPRDRIGVATLGPQELKAGN
jgi:predicted Zn-dependent peptidase